MHTKNADFSKPSKGFIEHIFEKQYSVTTALIFFLFFSAYFFQFGLPMTSTAFSIKNLENLAIVGIIPDFNSLNIDRLPIFMHICEAPSVSCLNRITLKSSKTAAEPNILQGESLVRKYWSWIYEQNGKSDWYKQVAKINGKQDIDIGFFDMGLIDICDRCQSEGALFGSDFYHLNNWTNPIFIESEKRAPKRTSRKFTVCEKNIVFNMVQRFSGDYGHFMAETLQRLLALRDSIRSVNGDILFECSGYLKKWIDFLGIDTNRIICTSDLRKKCNYVFAKRVIFSRYDGKYSHFPAGYNIGHDYIREQVLQIIGNSPIEKKKHILFIDRDADAKMTKHKTREWKNKDKVIRMVKRIISTNGSDLELVIFRGSKVDNIQDLVRLFQNAYAVFGTHGSGLNNLVFARRGTHVMEVYPRDVVFGRAYVISSVNDLSYSVIMSDNFYHGSEEFTCDTRCMEKLEEYFTKIIRDYS